MDMETIRGMIVETLTNGPFGENCFLVGDDETKKAILIDPGDEEGRIHARVEALGLDVQEIVNTHAHVDHAGAVSPLKRMLSVPFAIHPDERELLSHLPRTAAMFGLPTKEVPEVDRDLSAGEELTLGSLTARVLLTPGHSAGGCCFFFADQKVVFVGDTLFAGSVGRTDLPGGSSKTLITSIQEQLLTLDGDVRVFCGHGPDTTIEAERRHNPFLQPGSPLAF